MRPPFARRGLASIAFLPVVCAGAQPDPAADATRLPDVVVTGNPLASELFQLVPPVSVLGGRELLHRRASTLGETLSTLPGVASSQFGPNASRPVIRGLDGDRVRIMQNGTGVIDASAASVDHAVAVDPLLAERIEVVRGPAALLYGGSAIGGVVNVLDNRIPQDAVRGLSGRVEGRLAAGGDRERAGAAVLEAGNGRFSLHLDALARETDDLRIPGFARSQRLRAGGSAPAAGFEATGVLPNSAARSDGGAIGAAVHWSDGYAGVSYAGLDARYGTVAEPTVVIDLRSRRFDAAAEARNLPGAIQAVKLKLGSTRYGHDEIDAGVIGTRFAARGEELRLEATHARVGALTGAFGIQVNRLDFSALGDEAFVPVTATEARALFLYEELALGAFKLTFGGRVERTSVRSEGGGPIDTGTGLPRFDPPQTRNFSARSGALGGLYAFSPTLALAVNGSYSERAPTFQELFANGPHAATGAFEIGSPTFGLERSRALDIALRARSGPRSASLGAFVSRFDRFLALFATGNQRGAAGEVAPVDSDGDGVSDTGEEILPEHAYRAVPAIFRGIEAQGRLRLSERRGTLDLDLRMDTVRGYDRASGQPLPRIAPVRWGIGLDWRHDRLGARVDLVGALAQRRVTAAELPTDGYVMVNATLSHAFGKAPFTVEAFLRVSNLLDREVRHHTSFLKDVAPLAGRTLLAGLRGAF